jgi:hypothetical protein
MEELDRLGRRHKQLRTQLDELRPQLHAAIRAARAAGATYAELMDRSGYRTIQQIREICMTDEQREDERRKRSARTRKSSGKAG